MFDFLKDFFNKDKVKTLILGYNWDERVTLFYSYDNTKYEEDAVINVSVDNNLSLLSNLFTTNIIEPGTTYKKLSILSTSRFEGKIDNLEFLGEEYISMVNENFEFAYIFDTGSEYSIPATGIGVDYITFKHIRQMIENDEEIQIKIDFDIGKDAQYLMENEYHIHADEKSGTKICGCKNKKRK